MFEVSEVLEVLGACDRDELYSQSRRGSPELANHKKVINEFVKQGYMLKASSGCCYEQYFLTKAGKELLEIYRDQYGDIND